jgi:hypothetical protein
LAGLLIVFVKKSDSSLAHGLGSRPSSAGRMMGELMLRTTSGAFAAIAVACLLQGTGAARAADLGGACCDDLDARIAELEATAARKGNRVVSLTVTGQVDRALLFWDDGVQSDTYVVDNAIYTSRFGLEGKGVIKPGLVAGYVMQIDVNDALSSIVSQADPDGSGPRPGGDEGFGESSIQIRVSNVYIDSEHLGRLAIGQNYSFYDAVSVPYQVVATYNTDGGPYADGFGLRTSDGGLAGFNWGQLIGNGPRRNDYLRWDSPSFGGFGVMALVGDNDIWEVGAKYFTKTDRFALNTAIDYYNYDAEPLGSAGLLSNFQEVKGLFSVKDLPSGLFLTVWAAQRDYERTLSGVTLEDTGHSLQGFFGIEKRFLPLGNTTVYGGYGVFNNFASTGLSGASATAFGVGTNGRTGDYVADAEIGRTTFGVVQNIQAAAMDIYAIAEHYSADVAIGDLGDIGGATAKADLEDYFTVVVGSNIRF